MEWTEEKEISRFSACLNRTREEISPMKFLRHRSFQGEGQEPI